MFKIENLDGDARAGTFRTGHGIIQTPFFMPVATRGVGKYIGTDDYRAVGTQAIISNSFLLYLKPGTQVIDDLHTFMQFPGVIFTDSGGFQMLRASLLDQPLDKGILFNDPINKKKMLLTPELAMQIQMALHSDVAMCLDDVAPYDANPEAVKASLEHTHAWAMQCLDHHPDKRQQLFGIVQGGFIPELREQSARFLAEQPFDGYAIGGLAIGETKEQLYLALGASLPFIPQDKLRYGMGIGSPQDIVKCIKMGVDCFDSVFPTKNARHGKLFTWKGPIDISKGRYGRDDKPIDESCTCPVCTAYSRKYMHHLFRINDPMGKRYRQVHNLFYMQRLVREARIAITEQRFAAFARDVRHHYPDPRIEKK